MKALNKQTAPKSVAPERIIQFGEGNFLRAFVDWIVYNMNQKTDFNGSVVVVQPIEKGMAEWLNGQDCLYHVNLQGRLNGEAVNSLTRIDCISRALNPYSQNSAFMALADQPEIRFVISNTTEAGIAFDPNCKFSDAPASSYPGKLTQLLYRRFKTFKGDKSKGLIIMPCELIFLNGHHLKECIYQYIELWKEDFGADYEKFKTWFTKYCYVCATLVDRIVPGFPRKEIAQIQKKICYADNLVVQAEIFHLWVIEAAENLSLRQLAEEFPANKAGLNVLFVKSEAPYHERKVTLLNGPHTVLSPVAYLSGVNIVRDACNHPVIGKYVRKVQFDELMQTLNLPIDELKKFAADVLERFDNPYVEHQVTSIMLNSFPKYQTRDLPGLKTYLERNLKNFTPDFVARKSVFCFDNRMICLGTGISNSNASFPTETTLFQSTFQKGKTDIHVDGKLRNEAFHQTLDDKKRHYIQDGYNNYYFINGNDVQIQIAHQVSRHEKNRTETQGTFASAYINHGVSPQNAQYEYMILVQPTPEELKAVRRKAPYRILHKDDTAHVVADNQTGITAYAAFETYSPAKDEIFLSIPAETMVMQKQAGSKLLLSVCDPNLNISEKTYTTKEPSRPIEKKLILKGKWRSTAPNNKITVHSNQTETVLIVTCQHGQPVEFTLSRK